MVINGFAVGVGPYIFNISYNLVGKRHYIRFVTCFVLDTMKAIQSVQNAANALYSSMIR